jgi:endonuclease YncB( thermonuclease family)
MFNEQIVRDGYAIAKDYPPDSKHKNQLKNAEMWAKQQNTGLWPLGVFD